MPPNAAPKSDPDERPLLMSAEMVCAVLADRKTQTRRVLRPQPKHRVIEGRAGLTIGMDPALDGRAWYDADCIKPGVLLTCPYGRIGDRLWVRESWQAWTDHDRTAPNDLPEDARQRINYPANGNRWDAKVRPSIHMPRWASRLTLQITNIRVERVQQITDADAIAEGCPPKEPDSLVSWKPVPWFRIVWDQLNAKRGYGWDASPWVWCLTFRRCGS